MFKSAGSISGVVDLTGVKSKYGLPHLLGAFKDNPDSWKEHSVIDNLSSIANSGKEIILSCGRSDPFFEMNKDLIKKADSLKIEAIFINRPGKHEYSYWHKAIPLQLSFFKHQLKGQ